MQIDFHHAVTYVAARLAGFDHRDADIIAYAAQYVDDCTCSGTIWFDNKAMYSRISSSHKLVDIRQNFSPGEEHVVWVPFHFLPGNQGSDFVANVICRRGDQNPIADDIVRLAIANADAPNGLHRLGITMHVYADTWAHQGFAGIIDDVNRVRDVECSTATTSDHPCLDRLRTSFRLLMDRMIPAMGHARADVLPDMPFLKWQYRNNDGITILRPNTDDFCTAADAMCKAMKRYRLRNAAANVSGIPNSDVKAIRTLFTTFIDEDGHSRHREWLKEIARGTFSFGATDASYEPDGQTKTWKAEALGTPEDCPQYKYDPMFLTSDWKMFHDALQQFRLTLLHEILPKYSICAG